jgi:FkbM family methyltransferase
MKRLIFYYNHSLFGYFIRRVKEKWFTPIPSQVNHFGVKLQVDCLPKGMQEVLRAGNYESSEMKILPEFVSSDDKVLEIGGAIGFIGLYCRKMVGIKDLVSVEPNPKTISYLRRNYELNGFTPSIIEGALSVTDGPVQLQTSDIFWADSLVLKASTPTDQIITVDGFSFASIIKRTSFQFNVLIIDIEGAEQFLPVENIPHFVAKVLIEIHPEIIGVRHAYKILEFLLRSGFVVECHYFNAWALRRYTP